MIVNRRRSFKDIVNTILGIAVCWKVKSQLNMSSDSTDVELRYMYKYANKTKSVQRYTEDLALRTSSPTVHYEDNTHFISVVEAKIVTPRF